MTQTLNPTAVARTPVSGMAPALRAGAIAGFAAGVIVLVPVLILQLSRGIGVVPEMQLAASAVIGMAAYVGVFGFVLGTIMHFFVAIVPALLYAPIAAHVPLVNRLAWLAGSVLGLLVFLFMGFVVLPRSAFTTPPTVTPMPFLGALLIHMFAFGLPITLIVRRLLGR